MASATAPSAQRVAASTRLLLVVPALAGLGLGLFPLLAASSFASLTNLPPNDPLIYWLAGAGTLGYGVALGLGILQRDLLGLRLPATATLAFNALAAIACVVEITAGRATGRPTIILVLVLSLAFVAATYLFLRQTAGQPRPAADVAGWLAPFLIFGAVAAFGTGLLAYFGPDLFKPVFGLDAVNPFIYRMLGSATIGYGVLGVVEARSGRFAELRLGLLMGAVFNLLAVILGIIALASGQPKLLPITLLVAPVILTVGCVAALARNGR